jgi:hypothetical protein
MKTVNEKGQSAIAELAKFIPLENIHLYLKLYRALQSTRFRGLQEFPAKEISEIDKNLLRLYKSGWIDMENLTIMMDSLLVSIYWSKDGENINETIAASKIKKVGSPSNYAFNFLIYAIIFDLKYFTRKPHYGKAIDFLQECEIINSTSANFTDEELRKRFKRLKLIEIVKSLVYASRIAGNENNIQLGKITTEHFKHKKYDGFIHEIFSKMDDILSDIKISDLVIRNKPFEDAIVKALARLDGFLYYR